MEKLNGEGEVFPFVGAAGGRGKKQNNRGAAAGRDVGVGEMKKLIARRENSDALWREYRARDVIATLP